MPTTDAAVQQPQHQAPRPFWARKQVNDGVGRLMLKNLTHQEIEAWCVAEGNKQAVPYRHINPEYQSAVCALSPRRADIL